LTTLDDYRYLTTFDDYLTTLDDYRYLTTFDDYLTTLDDYRYLLTTFDDYLTTLDDYRYLTTFDDYLTTLDEYLADHDGLCFTRQTFHECRECSAPLLLASNIIEQHALHHHQLTHAEYSRKHMQVSLCI
jgi:hypothetical protein